jgi:hypothetical protein
VFDLCKIYRTRIERASLVAKIEYKRVTGRELQRKTGEKSVELVKKHLPARSRREGEDVEGKREGSGTYVSQWQS